MTPEAMWEQFKKKSRVSGDYAGAWAFGVDPDELAELVKGGVKTATASLYDLYGLLGEELPQAGDYHIVLDEAGEAACIIKLTAVYRVPYGEVTAEFAYKEGEGDRTLAYWRREHEAFFIPELKKHKMTFHSETPLLCEEFICVWPER